MAEQSQRMTRHAWASVETVLYILPGNSGEAVRAAANRQGQASCHARRRLTDIRAVQAFPGGKRPRIERVLAKDAAGEYDPHRPQMV